MAKSFVPTFRATFYTDVTLGQLGLGRLSDTGRAKGAVQAYHRGNVTEDGESPYAVANDFIGSQVGMLLGMPIPPGAITISDIDQSRPMYSCLDFDWTREILVNAEPDRCMARLRNLCTGIFLFDLWIANPDRESWNLKADDPINPSIVRVYDHADSLFNVEGEARLNRVQNSLGLDWPNRPGRQNHCLLPFLIGGHTVEDWLHKIASVPPFQICDICDAARAAGISEEESNSVKRFLLYRKGALAKIIERNANAFPGSFFRPPDGDLL